MSEWLSASAAITLASAAMAVARAGCLALLAGAFIRLRRPSASAQHSIWFATLMACAMISVLPSVASVPLPVTVPMPAWIEGRLAGAIGVSLTEGPYTLEWNPLVMAWAAGVVVLLIRVGSDLASVRQLMRRTVPVAPGIVMSDELRVPAVWGLRKSVIIVPRDVDSWNPEDRRAMLAHERAHLSRHDPLALVATRVLCAICWFNPVCWRIARRLELARECACDDEVVNAGVDRLGYARQLVKLATQSEVGRATRATACLVASGTPLPGRVHRLITPGARREAMPWTARLASGALVVAATFFSAVTPDTSRLHFLPVRNGTLVVEGRSRLIVHDMWPISFPPGDRGRVTVTLHSIKSMRATRGRPPVREELSSAAGSNQPVRSP